MKKVLLLTGSLLLALGGVAQAQDKIDFAKQIRPIFAETCYKCHGGTKHKGDFKLDNAASILKGGKEGSDVVAGHAEKSGVYKRITMKPDDDDVMPPSDKNKPLKKEQTDLIQAWITQGAEFGDWKQDEVLPVCQGSNLLTVEFTSSAATTTDQQIELLEKVAPQVYDLNLAGTKLTDAGLKALDGMTNLHRLHLEKTAVTDKGLSHLKNLATLEYLNLYHTDVTDAGLEQVQALKNLKHIYLWQSKVSDSGAEALKKALPAASVDVGWKEPTTTESAKEVADVKKTPA
jgi:mono/diheme cytochrome c family protein